MAILTDDYIIIIITCEKSTETSLRKRLNKGIQINNWCYAAIKNDNESKIIKSNDKQCNAEAKEVQGYQFFLIYAGCFKTEGDHQQCNGKIRKLINAIKLFNKRIILCTHTTDEIQCNSIQKCGTFSHGMNHPVEQFMENIYNNGNSFEKEFKNLIEYSLKKKLTLASSPSPSSARAILQLMEKKVLNI